MPYSRLVAGAAALVFGVSAAAAPPTATAQLLLTDAAAPLASVWPTFLSLNIDSASLSNGLDASDPVLTTLAKQLVTAAPTQLRFGGGTADDTCYTGADGPAANCTSYGWRSCSTCVNAAYIEQIGAFQAASGVQLVWDVNALVNRTGNGPWGADNAKQLLDHIAAKSINVTAWQLGNEPELWTRRNVSVSGTQLGQDFVALKALLASYGGTLSTTLLGPSACCDHSNGFIVDLLKAAGGAQGALAALDFHAYPIPRNASKGCIPADYVNVTQFRSSMAKAVQGYAAMRDAGAPGLPLVLGETATTAEGGCANLSNTFIAGFDFLTTLSVAAEGGVVQVNRQDLVGFSGPTEPSQYSLAGPAGWVRGSAALAGAVHPDYFAALLWKQLVGTRVLSTQLAPGTPPAVAQALDVHAWCAPGLGGAAVVPFANVGPQPLQLSLAFANGTALPLAPRVQYFVTAAPSAVSGADAHADAAGDAAGDFPAWLASPTAYLNGRALTVDGAGRVPQFPIPGAAVNDPGQALTLPAWSYGWVSLPNAGLPACM